MASTNASDEVGFVATTSAHTSQSCNLQENAERQEHDVDHKNALHEMRERLEDSIVNNQLQFLNYKSLKYHLESDKKKKLSQIQSNPHHSADSIDSSSSLSSSFSPPLCHDCPTLWGIPLLPSKGYPGTNVILMKFLRARDFKVSDALDMLQNTLQWRKKYGINDDNDDDDDDEQIALEKQLQNCTYMGMKDREGRPVCYNVYGIMSKDKELYDKAFGSTEKRERFVRWRVKIMERGIKQLLAPLINHDVNYHYTSSDDARFGMVQVIDLKDSLKPGMKELRMTLNKLLSLLQDNYPEFLVKTIFINVSLKYYAYHALFSQFITQRTSSKFVFARPFKVTQTLLKFIAPEYLPIRYGGLQRELNDDEFSDENEVSELVIKSGSKGSIQIPVPESCVSVVWDMSVVSPEGVSYKEEFIPDDEGSYKILIQKEIKFDESVRNSFYMNEPGKVIITIENKTYKKKRVLYRSKITKLVIQRTKNNGK